MSISFWPTLIGYFFAIYYTCTALYLFTGLIGCHDIGNDAKSEENEKVDPDTIDTSTDLELVKFSRKEVAAFTIKLTIDILMLITSILLIVGVKKQRHAFMAPWVYICGIALIFNMIIMFIEVPSFGIFVMEFSAFVIHIAMWYPVFRHYRNIKKSQCKQKNIEAGVENCMMNAPSAPYYVHANAYPCAPSAVEFVHSTAEAAPTAPQH